MDKRSFFYAFLLIALFGIVRMPIEQKLSNTFTKQGLLNEAITVQERNQLGQAGFAILFGGMRPFLASYLSIKAFNQLGDKLWSHLEKTYQNIVAIQPYSAYHWDVGAWYISYNIASGISRDEQLSPEQQEARRKRYIVKGNQFLKRGLKKNPNNARLLNRLVIHLTDDNRYPDYVEASKILQKLLARKDCDEWRKPIWRQQLFRCLVRMPGYEVAALDFGKKLWFSDNSKERSPMLACALFCLQNYMQIAPKYRITSKQLFASKETAYKQLRLYQMQISKVIRNKREFQYGDTGVVPQISTGLITEISKLEKVLKVPKAYRLKKNQIYIESL